jgi:hypothetical protein
MKKLFTIVALLAFFMGAKAEWVEDYSIDYSANTGFPFYVMGYVPEWVEGVMTDYGALYGYKTDAEMEEGDFNEVGTVTTQGGAVYHKVLFESASWHQYFIADGIDTGAMADTYTVKALVKASETVTINVNMGWGWGNGEQVAASVTIPAGDDFQEVEWEYTGIGGSSCNLVAQPGTATATIEWKSLTVGHNQKAQRPTQWKEWLTSDGQPVIVETTSDAIPTFMGNAETPWADPNARYDDATQNYLICAWGKENGRNLNDDGGHDPFPADIEDDGTGNHVFVVHAKDCTDPSADASAWDNQFWIESPKAWKEGEQIKLHFRYKASENVKTNTQVHHQTPSNYQHWQAIGDINFTTEWQEFDKVISWPSGAGDDSWSVCFNLNPEVKTAVDFYFDDLSWQTMVLDEGYFVAGSNAETGLSYDFDNAIKFEEEDDGEGNIIYVATIGEAGKPDTYVSEIMISTVRGNDAAFKTNTLKPVSITNDPDGWAEYTAASNAKLTLPGTGVWKIYIDEAYTAMAFEMLEGEAKEAFDVITNTTEIVINAPEREPTSGEQPADEEAGIAEGTGQPWDSQFWIVANRNLEKGTVTVIKFKYKAATAARASTQCHNDPGNYMHWAAIGDVNFTEEWQEFENEFTVPAEADGMKSIAFNLSEMRGANTYEIKDVQWYLQDTALDAGKTWENLIGTGTENFMVKEGANTAIFEFGKKPEPRVLLGDANKDGVIDVADVVAIVNYILEQPAENFDAVAADANEDQTIDVSDVVAVVNIILGQGGADAARVKAVLLANGFIF